MSDDVSKELAGLVKDFFSKVEKIRQGKKLFDEGHENLVQFEKDARACLKALAAHEEIAVRVSAFDFFVGEYSVYHNDDPQESLAYKFHQDGVKQIRFTSELEESDAERFVEVCIADFESPDYAGFDTVSLMWEFDFSGISYVAVETFSTGGGGSDDEDDGGEEGGEAAAMTEASVVSQLDGFVGSILGAALGEGGDASDNATVNIRISAEDLELLSEQRQQQMAEIATEDVSGYGDAGYDGIPASVLQEIRLKLDKEEKGLVRRHMEMLVELMVTTPDMELFNDFAMRLGSVLLDALNVGPGGLAAVARVVAQSMTMDNKLLRIKLADILPVMLRDPRVLRVVRLAASRPTKESGKAVAELLRILGPIAAPGLVVELSEINDTKMRSNWLAHLLRMPEFDLSSARQNICALRDDTAIEVIKTLASKESLRGELAIIGFCSHGGASVRRAALEAIAKSSLPEACEARRLLLDDPDRDVRMRALRYVQHSRDQEAVPWFEKKLGDDQVVISQPDDAKRWVIAYAAILRSRAVPFIRSMADQETGFRKSKSAEAFQMLAIEGLEIILHKSAIQELTELAGKKAASRRVKKRAGEAIENIKSRIQEQLRARGAANG